MSRLAPLMLVLGLVWVLPTFALAQRSETGSAAREPLDAQLQERIRWWQQLSSEEREALRGRHQQFQEMRPEQQEMIRDRMQRWRELRPHERRRMRERHQAFRSLPLEKQRIIQKNYKRWQHMSPAEKEKMRDRFKQLRALPKAKRERLLKPAQDPDLRTPPLRHPEKLRPQPHEAPTNRRLETPIDRRRSLEPALRQHKFGPADVPRPDGKSLDTSK